MRYFILVHFFIGLLISPFVLSTNSAEWQIKAYSSAAPAFIGDHATIIGSGGEILREGTNGWRCEPFIPMPEGGFKTPHETAAACSDKNAVAWANAYKANQIPQLETDGWIWMIHGCLLYTSDAADE